MSDQTIDPTGNGSDPMDRTRLPSRRGPFSGIGNETVVGSRPSREQSGARDTPGGGSKPINASQKGGTA